MPDDSRRNAPTRDGTSGSCAALSDEWRDGGRDGDALIGAFGDLPTAVAWFSLFGIPDRVRPPESGDGGDEPEPDDNDESESEDENDDEDDDEAEAGLGVEDDDADDETDLDGDDEIDVDEFGDEEGEAEDDDNNDELDPDDESPEPEFNPDKAGEIVPGTEDSPNPWAYTYSERSPTCVHREFDSWDSFVRCVSDLSQRTWKDFNCSSHRHDKSWSGTDTFDEAVRMASITGWPEGRELLSESFAKVSPRNQYYPTVEFSVAGSYPCVPIYCSGDPQCMVSDPGADHRTSKPIIRIDYNHWIHVGVTIKDMMLRGAAVLSLAKRLEEQGISTELRIIGNTREGDGDRERTWRYSIVYKKAGEYLDVDRAAYALAHPSAMRRLAFALLEQTKELEADFRIGYGHPGYEPNDTKPNTIFVNGSRGGETPEKANAAVEEAAAALLSELQQAA